MSPPTLPGSTTEILNEDIKELKVDIRDIRGDLEVMKADVHRIDVSLAELRSEVRSAIGIGKWAATILVGLLLTGGVSAVWWGSRIDANVANLEKRFDKTEAKSEARFDKTEARFDRLEASIAKILEQTRLAAPPAGK